VGVAEYAPLACAGPLLIEELTALSAAFDSPARPLVAVVGGSKVSTKIHLLDSLLDTVDVFIVGGGIANTFLKAAGHNIGQSLYEPDWLESAKNLLEKAHKKGVRIPLPVDVVVAKKFSADAKASMKILNEIESDDIILDVGLSTQASYPKLFQAAKTIVWNGPVGVFEMDAFSQGTKALGQAIAASAAFSVAGGGDTLSALAKFHLTDKISYVSTGGGAFLEYLEGRALPALTVLTKVYHNKKADFYVN
jgi:phosphoglycerate kinase